MYQTKNNSFKLLSFSTKSFYNDHGARVLSDGVMFATRGLQLCAIIAAT